MVMARTASIPGHDFIWKTAADAGFAPMWWRRPLMCRFCSPWSPAVLESLPSAMIWPVSARARWLYPPAGVPFANVRLMWNEDNQNPALPHLLDVFRSIC
ncbi:hypothetical protein M5E87_26690 [Flavonifractor plautii]|nr:hypothetical protein M5E87_26690 [Flavonifractor plautii]